MKKCLHVSWEEVITFALLWLSLTFVPESKVRLRALQGMNGKNDLLHLIIPVHGNKCRVLWLNHPTFLESDRYSIHFLPFHAPFLIVKILILDNNDEKTTFLFKKNLHLKHFWTVSLTKRKKNTFLL